MNQVIGWLSSAILVVTISTQLRKQWRTRDSHGVSKWLYIGQIAASTGFVVYSVQSRDWVFVVTNTVLGLEAIFGLVLVLAQRRAARAHAPTERSEAAVGWDPDGFAGWAGRARALPAERSED